MLKHNADLRNIYDKCKALPLLPADDIPEGLSIIEEEELQFKNGGSISLLDHGRLLRLFDYIRSYWLPSELNSYLCYLIVIFFILPFREVKMRQMWLRNRAIHILFI